MIDLELESNEDLAPGAARLVAIDRLDPPLIASDLLKTEGNVETEDEEVALVETYAKAFVENWICRETGRTKQSLRLVPMTAQELKEYEAQGGKFEDFALPISTSDIYQGRNGQSRWVRVPKEDPFARETTRRKARPTWKETFNIGYLKDVYPQVRLISYKEYLEELDE